MHYCHWSDAATRHPADKLLPDEEVYCEPLGESFGVRAVWVKKEGDELKLSSHGREPQHTSFTASVTMADPHVFTGSDFSLRIDANKHSEYGKFHGRFTGRGADQVLMSCLIRK